MRLAWSPIIPAVLVETRKSNSEIGLEDAERFCSARLAAVQSGVLTDLIVATSISCHMAEKGRERGESFGRAISFAAIQTTGHHACNISITMLLCTI